MTGATGPKRAAHADAFGAHVGIEQIQGADGRPAARLRVGAQHLNPWNGGHGGVTFTLADTALGLACNTQGKLGALVDSHMIFCVAVKEGDLLIAQAIEISRTNKLGVYRSDVRREDGTLVASLTGTVYLR